MFPSLERVALVLFAFVITLIAATMAFARPAMNFETEEREAAQPIIQSMACKEAIELAQVQKTRTTFVVNMRPSSYVVDSGTVTSPSIGTCGANKPSSAYNALGGTVDIHTFTAGGNLCKERDGSVVFTVFHDRRSGFSRHTTLNIKGVNYNCEY